MTSLAVSRDGRAKATLGVRVLVADPAATSGREFDEPFAHRPVVLTRDIESGFDA